MRPRISAAVLVALVLTISVLSLAPAMRADSVTYTYTGTAYTNCYGSYAPSSGPCTDQETISFTVASALAPDLNEDIINSLVTSFSFSDGSGLVITQANDSGGAAFWVSTDASGDIDEWTVDAGINGPTTTFSAILSYNGFDFASTTAGSTDASFTNVPDASECGFDLSPANCSSLNVGYVSGDPGSWSVPEPSSLALLAIGFVALITLRTRRRTGVLLSGRNT